MKKSEKKKKDVAKGSIITIQTCKSIDIQKKNHEQMKSPNPHIEITAFVPIGLFIIHL